MEINDTKLPVELEKILSQYFQMNQILSREDHASMWQVVISPTLPLHVREIELLAKHYGLEYISGELPKGLRLQFKKES